MSLWCIIDRSTPFAALLVSNAEHKVLEHGHASLRSSGHSWSLKRPAHPTVLSDQMICSRHSGPGCRPQYYFWESVTLSRNLLLVVLVFVAPGMGVGTSAACLLHAALPTLKEALPTH